MNILSMIVLARTIKDEGNTATAIERMEAGITENARWIKRLNETKQEALEEVSVTNSGAVTKALDAGKWYHFTGALTSLQVSFNAPVTGQFAQYHFDFNTGSTAFEPVLPINVVLPTNQNWSADTHYEIDVANGYALVAGWSVSS